MHLSDSQIPTEVMYHQKSFQIAKLNIYSFIV